MKPSKGLVAMTALALALPLAVHAQRPGNPILGKWTLNVAKSKIPGAAPKSQTRTFVQTPDGIHLTIQTVAATGARQTIDSTFKLDGKPYSVVGNPNINIDANAFTRISRLEMRADLIRAGKIIGHAAEVVSSNHRTLTIHNMTAGGQETNVLVFDRQ